MALNRSIISRISMIRSFSGTLIKIPSESSSNALLMFLLPDDQLPHKQGDDGAKQNVLPNARTKRAEGARTADLFPDQANRLAQSKTKLQTKKSDKNRSEDQARRKTKFSIPGSAVLYATFFTALYPSPLTVTISKSPQSRNRLAQAVDVGIDRALARVGKHALFRPSACWRLRSYSGRTTACEQVKFPLGQDRFLPRGWSQSRRRNSSTVEPTTIFFSLGDFRPAQKRLDPQDQFP